MGWCADAETGRWGGSGLSESFSWGEMTGCLIRWFICVMALVIDLSGVGRLHVGLKVRGVRGKERCSVIPTKSAMGLCRKSFPVSSSNCFAYSSRLSTPQTPRGELSLWEGGDRDCRLWSLTLLLPHDYMSARQQQILAPLFSNFLSPCVVPRSHTQL